MHHILLVKRDIARMGLFYENFIYFIRLYTIVTNIFNTSTPHTNKTRKTIFTAVKYTRYEPFFQVMLLPHTDTKLNSQAMQSMYQARQYLLQAGLEYTYP